MKCLFRTLTVFLNTYAVLNKRYEIRLTPPSRLWKSFIKFRFFLNDGFPNDICFVFSQGLYRTWKSSENQVLIGLEGSQYCPLLAACRVHTAPESSSPQIVTGRWNLGNLGPTHSVDLRLHMGWKTLRHWVRQGDLAAAHVQHLHHFPFFGDWVDGDYHHNGEANCLLYKDDNCNIKFLPL